MGTAVVVILIISVLATGMAWYVFQHPILQLGFEGNFWNGTEINDDVKITRDALYSASFAGPIFVIGVLTIWAVLAMVRRQDL